MLRELGSHPRRIALIAVVAIACASVAAYLLCTPRPAPHAPASIQAPAASAGLADASPSAPATAPSSAAAVAAKPASAVNDASPPLHGAAGMIVGIDPETGRLRLPSQAERAALASPAIDQTAEGLTVVQKPDGSKMIDLQGHFQDYMVVRLTPDGRKLESCVQASGVEAALKGAPASATSPAGAAPAPAADAGFSTAAPTER